MLGGLEVISPIDLEGSANFLSAWFPPDQKLPLALGTAFSIRNLLIWL